MDLARILQVLRNFSTAARDVSVFKSAVSPSICENQAVKLSRIKFSPR